MTRIQIWLNPCANNCQSTLAYKIGGKKNLGLNYNLFFQHFVG